jgi:exodeoxyribonuclease VII small subunit
MAKKTEQAPPDPGETPSYEEARQELVEVVRALEAGGTTLEESLALWERGERLATLCQDWLDGARERLDAAIEADDEPDED